MKPIFTENAPAPLGHYSQAIAHNNTLYISGQLPLDANGEVPATIAEQTTLTLQNLEAILKEAGSSKDNVLKATIYFKGLDNWAHINEAYADFFGTHKPARAAVPVPDLPKGCLIEIEAVAAL